MDGRENYRVLHKNKSEYKPQKGICLYCRWRAKRSRYEKFCTITGKDIHNDYESCEEYQEDLKWKPV